MRNPKLTDVGGERTIDDRRPTPYKARGFLGDHRDRTKMLAVPGLTVCDEALLKFFAFACRKHLLQEELTEAGMAEDVAALLSAIADDKAGDYGGGLLLHSLTCKEVRRKRLQIGAGKWAESDGAECQEMIDRLHLRALLAQLGKPVLDVGLKTRRQANQPLWRKFAFLQCFNEKFYRQRIAVTDSANLGEYIYHYPCTFNL